MVVWEKVTPLIEWQCEVSQLEKLDVSSSSLGPSLFIYKSISQSESIPKVTYFSQGLGWFSGLDSLDSLMKGVWIPQGAPRFESQTTKRPKPPI